MGKQQKFTLIELLVAMAIIIILIGMAVPAYRIAVIKAREGQAKFQIKELQTAIVSYSTQYQFLPFYPAGNKTQNFLVNGADYATLQTTLRGTDSTLNPRKLEFLSRSSEEYLDPWGNMFFIVLDLDGNGAIEESYLYGETGSVSTNVAIWSMGRDGAHSSTDSDSSNNDNITSWTK